MAVFQDCNQLQEYRKGECRCVCTNKDAEQKCSQDNDTKLWNPDSCLCECRRTTECSTGSFFSQTSCRYLVYIIGNYYFSLSCDKRVVF